MSNHAATTPLESDAVPPRAPSESPVGGPRVQGESADPQGAGRPWQVRAYKVSRLAFDKLIVGLKAVHVGFWLGVLDKAQLDMVGKQYYDDQNNYRDDTYNRQGLWAWEEAMIGRFFPSGGRLLVAAAGGGREIYSLHQRGFQIDAFECHAELLEFASRFLREQGVPGEVLYAPCDRVPEGAARYDGVIIGWSAYMLIQGRHRRVAFLESLRARVEVGAPLLLSFFTRRRDGMYYPTVRLVANLFRGLTFRERVELGDSLAPNYVHYFNQAELAAELLCGGFELEYYGTREYGHAVARAR